MNGGENILENIEDVVNSNQEPYNSIYDFIKSDIIPKYPCLTSVFQDNFDEEGDSRIQYYIRYAADLTLDEWRHLRFRIRKAVEEFCISLGIPFTIYSEIDLIVTVDGEFYERYGTGF